jgi:muconate cycloisomerase
VNYPGERKPLEAERIAEPPLRLKRIDVFPVTIPLKQPMKMAGILIRSAENLFVRIESVDGVVGWGEAASAPTMTGETLWGMVSATQLIWDAIKESDIRFAAALVSKIQSALYGNMSAKSAVEMALLDLMGRTLGVSAGEMLGGRVRDRLEPMWLLGRATPDEDIADARVQRANGCGFFKLKVGTKTVEGDVASALGVREALGMNVKLCADANGGLTLSSAKRLIRDAEPAKLLYLEQPLPADDLDAMAKLQALDLVPIGADEGIHAQSDIEAHATRGAAAGVSLKLIKLGGMTATLRCAHRAIELGLSVNVAAKVAESSLGSAAASHLACSIANLDWGISLTQVYLEHDPVYNPLTIIAGAITPPQGPGLGVEVDESAIRHYRAPPPL